MHWYFYMYRSTVFESNYLQLLFFASLRLQTVSPRLEFTQTQNKWIFFLLNTIILKLFSIYPLLYIYQLTTWAKGQK